MTGPPRPAPLAGIFISYRRDDSSGHAGRLYDRLCARFGAAQVFMDVEAIDPGVDFVARIEQAVSSCQVLIALIGRGWTTATGPDGRRRLEDPADMVRLEVSTALARHVPVIPVLVPGATMPRPEELPAPLLPLVRHNATRIDDDRFDHDVQRLIDVLDELVGAPPDLVPAGPGPGLACPSCSADNPPGSRFCLACGTRVGEPPDEPREVRKTVTAVAAAMAISVAVGESLDPERLRGVLDRCHERAAAVFGRHGGTVYRTSGETVLALFGVPTLHEDDAVRAVRAAAELHDALAELRADMEAAFGVRLRPRSGIDTGEVVVTGADVAVGDPVNRAARLERTATAGEILLSKATHWLVRDAVTVEPVVPAAGPAEAAPDACYRLLAVSRDSPGHARRLDAPIVGRGRELRLLAEAFDRSVSERVCYLFTVLGAAGVGKSRLVHELLAGTGRLATVLEGRCLHYGEGITFWPVAEVVRQAAGVAETDSADAVRHKLAALLEGTEQAGLVAERVAFVLGLAGGAAGRDELAWAVRKLLEALTRRRPLIVVLDDLQWAEPTLLDLVEHVADWTRDAPLLLVCVARPELLDARPGWGGGKLNATTILLEPLGAADCARLLDNLLGRVEGAAELRQRIMQVTEGNPLFVEELLAVLVEDGLLVRKDDAWTIADELEAVPVPPTISALLAARLDRLGGGERSVLERASVVGQVFYRGAVTELSPAATRPDVPAHLLALVRKELIRPDPAGFAGDDGFRFRHLLFRDAAYRALPKRERAGLHERFAGWLERMAGDRLAEYEEIVGYHLEQAYRYLQELGPVGDHGHQLARRAVERLLTAGRRAYGRGDAAAAGGLLDRAVDLLEPSEQRLEASAELAEALITAGEFGRADTVLTAALNAADRAGNRRLRAYLALVRLRLEELSGTPAGWYERTRTQATEAISVFEEAGDDRGLAMAWTAMADASWQRGRSVQTAESLERALAHARRAGAVRWVVRALTFLPSTWLSGPTPVDDAFRRCQEIAGEADGVQTLPPMLLSLQASLRAMQGRFQEARALAAQAKDVWTDIGRPMQAAAISMEFGDLELLAGDAPAAERELRAGYRELERRGEDYWRATIATILAEATYRQGHHDEAERWAGEGERLAGSDDLDAQVRWRAVRAKVLAARGDRDRALALGREALALARTTDFVNLLGEVLMGLAEVLRLTGSPAESAAAVREALTLYERKGNIPARNHARQVLAELREHLPNPSRQAT